MGAANVLRTALGRQHDSAVIPIIYVTLPRAETGRGPLPKHPQLLERYTNHGGLLRKHLWKVCTGR